MRRFKSLIVELLKMADNADSVVPSPTLRCEADSNVLSSTVRYKVFSDATLLRLLPSENRFKQETIHSLGYIIYTLSCK
jgi:hypothetical protein